ncbi:MAG: hypothetical protein UU20_C0035G0003 [Parcubacteria group bacterium GW2011_GWE2_40_8]|nr:MAG: hypothetical protein UU20_C0035G0003 [Parcubacteria group bacterium GW2011_GWE2_40_8]
MIMRKQYRQNKKRGFKKRTTLAVLLVFLLLVIFSGGAREIVAKSVSTVFYPFAKTGQIISKRWHNFAGILKNKKKMNLEIDRLAEENETLEVVALSADRLKEENIELKALFGREREKNVVLASVIMRPPQSPYDMLVLDAGAKEGVRLGMKAVAHGEILIGYVTEVSEVSSKVKLLSFPKEEIGVILENASISAIAVGTGGGNMELQIPGQIEVAIGQSIITTGIFPYTAGIAEKIEADTNNPFKKIIFRLPININYLRSVILTE